MKKIYKIALLSITVAGSLQAQVSSLYTFSQFAGTYSAITGGTVFGTTTSDDQIYVDPNSPATSGATGVGIPIGFNFLFNNTIYNRIGINNNGWIGFGHSSLIPAVDLTNTGSNYTGISSASNAPPIKQNRVAGLSRDIQAQTGSSLRVQTLGTAPSRTCIVQFENYKKYGTNGTGDNFNFQIRLIETSNIVQIIYGTFVNNANADVAEVGLRGNSNADYNNRIVNTANPWNASIPGTANNSQVNYNNAGLSPASGQVYQWSPPQCSGTLGSLTAAALPTLVCPNSSADIFVQSTSTLSGLTYTWYESTTSAVGLWTLVPTADGPVYTTPGVTVTTWYQAGVTCLNSASSATTSVAQVQVAATTTNSVPYFEGFEGLTVANRLPNCSWLASGLGTSFQTYLNPAANNRVPRTGSKFGAFGGPTSNAFVFTNGIWMEPGITYSAAAHFATDYSGATNWSSLALLLGTAQNLASSTQLASETPAVSGPYKLLSDTFMVSAPGFYYVGLRASGGSGGAPYLMIDDISVTIPCHIAPNSPTISITQPTAVACQGQPINVSVAGADLYGSNPSVPGPVLSFTPGFLGLQTFQVVGEKTLTGCFSSANFALQVQPVPNVFATASPPVVCAGKASVLTAGGADFYVWNPFSTNQMVTVSPAQTSTYMVVGTNSQGCSASAVVQVSVNTLPVITASSNVASLCVGEPVTLSATGGTSYTWVSLNTPVVYQGQNFTIMLTQSDKFTVTGTGANGCEGVDDITLDVQLCIGLAELQNPDLISVSPNPSGGEFVLKSSSPIIRVTVSDLSGRLVGTFDGANNVLNVDLQNVENGIYLLSIETEKGHSTSRVIKE